MTVLGRARVRRGRKRAVAVVLGLVAAVGAVGNAVGVSPSAAALTSTSAAVPTATLTGEVLSGAIPLAATQVTLYRARSSGAGPPVVLGVSQTRANGSFAISYPAQRHSASVLYVIAGQGAAVRLATVLGTAPVPGRVVVNERTTVAAGVALAEFINGHAVAGKAPGPQNAAAMAGDLADPRTGGLSRVLATAPNGNQTSTLATFNSLANMLVPCVRSASRCGPLFQLATPPGDHAPQGTLDAIADITRNPAHNVRGLFALARSGPAPYQPALGASGIPDAWTVALRFAGNGNTMNGPGNMAIDAHGDVWSTDNYTFSKNPAARVCGGKFLLKFTPTGQYVQGSPYTGGGLNGAGFGITLDPHGNVWVGNFGFSAAKCPKSLQPPHRSVSEFSPQGVPLSPPQTHLYPGGFIRGGVSWPQGTVSDRHGSIWIANCGNNTVTRYARGNPRDFTSLSDLGITKPFDIAFNDRGQAFVTGNGNSKVAMLNPDGTAAQPPISGGGIDRPLGIGADIEGNMWVANSGFANVPCPDLNQAPRQPGSITLINSNGTVAAGSPFTGGGLTAPWGVAVDGHDNVWVANFAGQRLSEFCGNQTANCPAGTRTGQPISPSTGYGFDGLVRNTGVQIDPSGNVWVANNWKKFPFPARNPGGYQMVVFIGLAGPLRTPLIGPPRPL